MLASVQDEEPGTREQGSVTYASNCASGHLAKISRLNSGSDILFRRIKHNRVYITLANFLMEHIHSIVSNGRLFHGPMPSHPNSYMALAANLLPPQNPGARECLFPV